MNLTRLLPLLFLFTLFFGCNDKPDPVGASILTSNDLKTTSIAQFSATQHKSEKSLIYTSNVDRIMIGKNDSYEAWACLKFSDFPDELLGSKITKATIQLKGLYHFGKSTASLSFNVYRAKASLGSDSLTYDSLQQNLGNFYYDNIPIPIIPNIPVGDTLVSTIEIVDTSIIREWFASNTDTTHANDGLIFRPTNSEIIKGYNSFNAVDTALAPTLIVEYIDTSENPGTYSHKSGSSKYVSTFDSTTILSNTNYIYIQNGIAYHGNLWFDTFTLPRQSSIYRATLEMTLDASSSPNYLNETLYASRTLANGTIDYDYLSYEGTPIDTGSGKRLYRFEIPNIITAWKNGLTIPKLIISGKNESLSFDLFKFYGTGSSIADSLKPRIIITYLTK